MNNRCFAISIVNPKKFIVEVIVLLAISRPIFIAQIPLGQAFVTAIRVLILLLYLLENAEGVDRRIPRPVISIFVYYALLVGAQLYNKISFLENLYYLPEAVLQVVSFFYFYRHLSADRESRDQWIYTMHLFFWVELVLIFLTRTGDSISSYTIITAKNAFAPLALVMELTCVYLYSFSVGRSKKISALLQGAVVLLAAFYIWATTTIVVVLVFSALVLFFGNARNSKASVCLFFFLYIIQWVGFFIVIVFRKASGFTNFLTSALGKSPTFHGRSVLWDQAMIEFASANPIIGKGYSYFHLETWDPTVIESREGWIWGPHNSILEILLFGGILLLLVYNILLFVSVKGTAGITNRFSIAAISAWFGYSLMMYVEAVEMLPEYMFILCCMSCMPYLAEKKKMQINYQRRREI